MQPRLTNSVMDEVFEAFVRVDGERLRRVLVARYGVDVGCDAAAAALAWAWQHWDRLSDMANPAGYVYRVGQTHARRALDRARRVTFPAERMVPSDEASVPGARLAAALEALPERQRVAVLMVHAYGWTPSEVAQITGVPAVTIRSHLRRGLRQLHSTLSKGTQR
jgi:RNA polymerase sigma-70 factor (ECF subfamily)